MQCNFSFIIPVFNRPGEMQELLESISIQTFDRSFEVVVIEDGSK
ncbi:MAG: glycosyltransferase, partial [Eudoraea sp.]|nr:glycosyltransferase [Eudoraea sp.]